MSQFLGDMGGTSFFGVITWCLLLGLYDVPSLVCSGKIKDWGVSVR